MCEVYGFCGSVPTRLNKYTDEFWLHSRIHQDGFGFYLADKNELYVNPHAAMAYIGKLNKKDFTSKLALCHIRFKTHGRGVRWSLIHNGYIADSPAVAALGTLQKGETDSERILLAIIEAVNSYYEHSWVMNQDEFFYCLYLQIESALTELASLGKTNLIFTDNLTNNMYVYMNHPNTLYYLNTNNGVHISTTRLSDENWQAVEPYKLHIFNNGIKLDY